MYSHLNDPFSEGGKKNLTLRSQDKNHFDAFSAYECILLCVPIFFFFFKDLVDIHGGIVILEFRLYKAIIQ